MYIVDTNTGTNHKPGILTSDNQIAKQFATWTSTIQNASENSQMATKLNDYNKIKIGFITLLNIKWSRLVKNLNHLKTATDFKRLK